MASVSKLVPVTLAEGDVCWCVHNCGIYVVKIRKVVSYPGIAGSETLLVYRVETNRSYECFGDRITIHRDDLFKFPEEQALLKERLTELNREFKRYLAALDDNQKPEPEIVHGVRLIDVERISHPELGRWFVD